MSAFAGALPLRYPQRATLPRDGEAIVVCGMSGSGKTTLAVRSLVDDVVKRGRTAAIFDPTGDVQKYLSQGSAASAPLPQFEQVCRGVKSARQAKAVLANRGLFDSTEVRVAVFSSAHYPGVELDELANEMLELQASSFGRGMVFFFDEADLIWPNSQLRGRPLSCVTLIRNRRQRCYFVTQRPQAMHTRPRQNATHVAVFRADSRNFLETGCREFGDVELFEPAAGLARFEYLYRETWREDPAAALPRLHAVDSEVPW